MWKHKSFKDVDLIEVNKRFFDRTEEIDVEVEEVNENAENAENMENTEDKKSTGASKSDK